MPTLRVSEVLVQPVLVWDDGEELSPGPGVEATKLPLSKLATFGPELLAQLPELAEKLAQQQIGSGVVEATGTDGAPAPAAPRKAAGNRATRRSSARSK